MRSYLYKSYDILGYVLFVNYGQSYHVLCNKCCRGSIVNIRRKERVTEECPIFVDSEAELTCEECGKIISVEND